MILSEKFKKGFTCIFIALLIIVFFKSKAYVQISPIFQSLRGSSEDFTEENESLTIDDVESDYISDLWCQKEMINLNGTISKFLTIQSFYSEDGVYVTKDNYIVTPSKYTSTDYEYSQLVNFKAFLDENGINLLYVNEPTKYLDDSEFISEFGIDSYSNRNMDLFLSRIHSAGITAIDLRENIKEENMNIRDMFYRTDHHWTTASGIWASGIIVNALNTYFGYDIDSTLYMPEKYHVETWSNCWLGEQGRKVAQSYIGLDDYSMYKPTWPTKYTFYDSDGSVFDGTFDDFIDESIYDTNIDVFESKSWHYSYTPMNCVNNNVSFGNILILGDSYDIVTEPFISLGINKTSFLVLRDCSEDFDLRKYIVDNDFDTVIISYAQFILGAHDDINNANYRMYTFQ